MAEQENLNGSLIVSTCLHVGVMLFLYFGVPSFFNPLPTPQNWRPIPVDIVEIGEITNTRILGQEEAASAPPPPSKQTPPAEEKKPEPPTKVEAKPSEMKMEEPDPAALPKPQTKPKPPEPAKQQPPMPDQLTSVLKNIAKLKPAAPKTEETKTETKNNESTTAGPGGVVKPGATTGGFGPALSDRLTITAEDALRRQISGCWNMPVGARNAEELIVEVLIDVNPDRTVARAEVVDKSRLASDTYFRAAAESALRALKNPRCSPLELPPDGYDQWKTIRFTFDPRDML